jgi:hypothetical protein
MLTPGSLRTLEEFHAFCRSHVHVAVTFGELPRLLFADGPTFDEPLVRYWDLDDVEPTSETSGLIDFLIGHWLDDQPASQVGLALPLGGDEPSAVLLSADESGRHVEQASVTAFAGQILLGPWLEAAWPPVAYHDWQQCLAANAGYQMFAKWRCESCRSVCPGEAALIPAPCDFCGSTAITTVALDSPLREPEPPWDASVA